jgi:hypothetical protein
MRFVTILVASTALLAGCETPTSQRYAPGADNVQAIRSLGASGVGVDSFRPPPSFDPNCRAVGAIAVADGISHSEYIRKAFADELKMAGATGTGTPRVVLSGVINKLEFSSSRGLTGGVWIIDLDLASSNGRRINVNEQYEFTSGFEAMSACRNTADAFPRAVQNLVGKAVSSPQFPELLK